MWRNEMNARRAAGGDLYFHRPRPAVMQLWQRLGFITELGTSNIFPAKRIALSTIFAKLDRDICAHCTVRVFEECAALPLPPAALCAGGQRATRAGAGAGRARRRPRARRIKDARAARVPLRSRAAREVVADGRSRRRALETGQPAARRPARPRARSTRGTAGHPARARPEARRRARGADRRRGPRRRGALPHRRPGAAAAGGRGVGVGVGVIARRRARRRLRARDATRPGRHRRRLAGPARRRALYPGPSPSSFSTSRCSATPARLRFEQEGAILARLSHPHIARLLDAGITGGSQPYLVLELIEGERIDRHCDARRLSVAGRVALFLDALGAVAHAHRHLVIHRDIKPSNILVAEDGGVKLLDFGIAKLLQSDAAADSSLTVDGQHALTPEYAAPEQLRGGDVTTATDVYSLGVLLYQFAERQAPDGIGAHHLGRGDALDAGDRAGAALERGDAACRRRDRNARAHRCRSPHVPGAPASRARRRPRQHRRQIPAQGSRRALCDGRCLRRRPAPLADGRARQRARRFARLSHAALRRPASGRRRRRVADLRRHRRRAGWHHHAGATRRSAEPARDEGGRDGAARSATRRSSSTPAAARHGRFLHAADARRRRQGPRARSGSSSTAPWYSSSRRTSSTR